MEILACKLGTLRQKRESPVFVLPHIKARRGRNNHIVISERAVEGGADLGGASFHLRKRRPTLLRGLRLQIRRPFSRVASLWADAGELIRRGVLPTEDGWGGWLGRYQTALRRAAIELEYPPIASDRDRVRDRSFDR